MQRTSVETASQVPGPQPHDADVLGMGGGMIEQGAKPTVPMEGTGDQGCPWDPVYLLLDKEH